MCVWKCKFMPVSWFSLKLLKNGNGVYRILNQLVWWFGWWSCVNGWWQTIMVKLVINRNASKQHVLIESTWVMVNICIKYLCGKPHWCYIVVKLVIKHDVLWSYRHCNWEIYIFLQICESTGWQRSHSKVQKQLDHNGVFSKPHQPMRDLWGELLWVTLKHLQPEEAQPARIWPVVASIHHQDDLAGNKHCGNQPGGHHNFHH